MISLRPRIASALRRAGQIAVERPRAALWTTLALTCALFAVGVAAVAATSVDRWTTDRAGSTASMVVYLGEGVDDARAQQLVHELAALRGVERAELVPPQESARRLVQALGSDAQLLEGVDVSALPGSVEVTLAPGVRDVIALSPTVHALRGKPGVADIVVEDPDDDRIAGALHAVRAIAWAAAALFAGLALITVIAAIRVRLDRDRRELAVVELLGGGPTFVVVPTACAGALQGLAAALLAVVVLALALHLYAADLTAALASTLGPVELAVPGGLALAGFVAAGALLGLVGGALAGASRVAR
ncbi:MAG TPA: permease-like cell division protein FtsX [Kofleriaceae bacterium]|nr:permease-like cell division protein FtsX [Kofleriaceae bacterium]